MQATIFCVGLSKLQNISKDFNNQFLDYLLTTNPQLGSIYDNYYIINNKININLYTNLPPIYFYYSNFVMLAAAKAPLTQILKNQ